MLVFDAGTPEAPKHDYTFDGVRVPHVTGVIKDLTSYDMVNANDLEIARQKGTAVHKMIELWSKKDLDTDTLPDWMKPCLVQWEQFALDLGLEIRASECRLFHPIYKYATTLDLAVTARNKKGLGIIEVKRSFCAGVAIGLQTAAQAASWDANNHLPNDKIKWRGALKIKEGQAYRFEEHNDKTDWTNFLGCLVHHNLIERYKK